MSIPNQIKDGSKACRDHGWSIVREVVIPGQSRNYELLSELIEDSPEYGEIIEMVLEDQVDILVCRHFDRIWRTDDIRAQVSVLCRRNYVQIYALNMPIEPTPLDELRKQRKSDGFSRTIIEAISGIASEWENVVRAERARDGMHSRIKDKRQQFSSTPPYGYYRDAETRLQVWPEHAKHLRWIFEQRGIHQWSLRRIAHSLNDRGVASPRGKQWLPSTVANMVKNRTYVGEVKWGEATCLDADIEPLVSKELWRAANSVRSGRGFAARKHTYPLRGLAYCGYCLHVIGQNTVKDKHYGQCSYHQQTKRCRTNSVRVHIIEQIAMEQTRAALLQPEVIHEALISQRAQDNVGEAREQIINDLTNVKARRERSKEAYLDGILDKAEFRADNDHYQQQIDLLEQQIRQIDERGEQIDSFVQQCLALGEYADELDHLSDDELNYVYSTLYSGILCRERNEPVFVWRPDPLQSALT